MFKYAIAVFLSAFLLFQVQPIVAKFILPWFGGASSVWAICLVFFQLFLLLGYSYAHLLSKVKSVRHQGIIHSVLVGVAILGFLPIEPRQDFLQGVGNSPQVDVFVLLVLSVGLPYALISSSGPLFQSWFQKRYPKGLTYRLYALSNVGSLLGLLSYPFLVEPFLSLELQTGIWSIGFIAYFILCVLCCLTAQNNVTLNEIEERETSGDKGAGGFDLILWITLSGTASVLLLATTNRITQDVASVPLLWILPLSLYLISFIICFDKPQWYRRLFWIPLLIASSVAALIALLVGNGTSFLYQIGAYVVFLFVGCMVCHGELYLRRPHPDFLTKYYLAISFGGALGGSFVSLVAPNIFQGYWEYHLVWVLLFVLIGLCVFSSVQIKSRLLSISGQITWMLMCVTLAFTLFANIEDAKEGNMFQSRGFFGVLRLTELWFVDHPSKERLKIQFLYHGAIIHGAQLIGKSGALFSPTTYYGAQSGVGLGLKNHPKSKSSKNLDVGVLGMGAATIASLCSDCKSLTFFEIDPQVIEVEKRYFSNVETLHGMGVDVEVVEGDGRISMSEALGKERPYQFDVLAVDAFSGDAIPVHLLTVEAVELYWKNMKPGGVLAMHVSNRHLDITPVVVKIAQEIDKKAFLVSNPDDDANAVFGSEWILMTNNREFIDSVGLEDNCTFISAKEVPVWTDRYSNILRILKSSWPEREKKVTCFN